MPNSIQDFRLSQSIVDPDLPSETLSAKQFSTIVEILGEGVIAGFPSALDAGLTHGTTAYTNASLKDTFLNGTQVLQSSASNSSPADSDFNFQNITFASKLGTSDQTAIGGISEIETEIAVGVAVTQSTPVSRTLNSGTDAVRITLGFPALQDFQDNGDINGAEVALTIQVIDANGTVTTSITDTVKGRTASPYFRDYEISFSLTTLVAPYTIRVNRTTADSTEATLQNAMQWTSYTEIIHEQKAYANTAHTAVRFSAETFPSIPQRMYKVRGTLIKIPHNATVRADGSLSYSGVFNGTFKADKAYTNDPSWILYDLLTTSKGFGDQIAESQLDVYSFQSASAYCGTQVDDGLGGTEPRFATNVVIRNSQDAYSLINDLCSVMRVMPFYSAGVINISQDRPADPAYCFNLSNVTEAGFAYNSSAKNTKFSVVNVSYFDNETQTIDHETVEDSDLITKYGVNVKNIKGFATTSRGQANRLAKWFLYTQSNEGQVVTFTTTIDAGVIVRPGSLIQVQDPVKAGVRRGGRVKTGVSTTQVIVDNSTDTDLTTVGDATLSVILPDGTLETKSISTISGSTITVGSAFSAVPQANTAWVLENVTVELQLFRVISITESAELNYQITAVAHNPNKYASVEDGAALPARVITTLTAIKAAPTSLTATEQIVVLNNRAVSKLFIQWEPVAGVTEYNIQYRFNNENYISERITRPDFTIFETLNGTYEIRVFSINALGKPSTTPATTTITTVGKTAVPADVQNLFIEPISDQFVRLRFDKSTDVDVLHGGNVVIRSSNLTSGATFTNAVDVLPALSGNVNETIVPNIVNGTYILKFQDDGGRLSSGDASVVMLQTEPDVFPKLIVLTDREDTDSPPFAGAKVDCFFSNDVNGLVLGSLEELDSVADFDAIADFDFLGAVDITGGSYEFADTLDLGAKQPLHLRRHIVSQGYYPNDLIDKRTANIDTWTDFDAATAFNVGAKLLVATTDSDPDTSTSATYAQSGTTITITKSSHGYSVGSFVVLDFTTGNGVDGNYQIQTVPNANTFTLTATSSQTTSGNCTYSAEFSQFNPFVNGSYIARGFKFRCEMDSDDPAQSIEIDQLGYTAELHSRTETSLGNAGATNGLIASGTSSKTVTFTNSFFTGQSGTSIAANSVLPSIGITIENAQSGDFFALSSISSTGFVIDVKNGSSFVDRNFKYSATGFGRGS